MTIYSKLNAKYTVYGTASKYNWIDEKLHIYYIDHNEKKQCQAVSDIFLANERVNERQITRQKTCQLSKNSSHKNK